MKKALPIGVADFNRLINDNYYMVDKTLMIKDFLERGTLVTLVTRPRRFGKTLNMSMMAEFFDITKDSKDIFKDTQIMNTEYAKEMNQWPTIFISFAGAKENRISIVQQIKMQLKKLYDKYAHVFDVLTHFEEETYQNIVKSLVKDDDGNLDNIANSISFLMEIVEKHYQKKVMVFIDEYDTPFIEAHVHGFYEEIRGALSSMLHNSLKMSTSFQFAMLTGIQRVAKENIFSDLNNIVVCTLKDNRYAQYFGFTEAETKKLLEYYELELSSEVKQMYNGYHIGNQEIYNPWSIINYSDNKTLESYWVNTSSNTMIKKAIAKKDSAFDREYERLLEQGYLETLVKLDTSFFEVSSTSNLWGLFVNAGYLTITKSVSIKDSIYRLEIPNQEVEDEFRSLTSFYLDISETDLTRLYNSLKYNKKEDFIEIYQDILMSLPSFHDLKNENSYHMMMLGMCAWLKNDYEIISNREVGKGRCDIILKAKTDKPSYIFEFKYVKEKVREAQLNEIAKQAIKQIEKQEYDYGLIGKVIYVGLAFCHKNVAIQWVEKRS